MSATLGALVIAISTEFSVLLTARYREERAAGLEPADGAARAPTARPARRCSPPASRRSPASPCSRSRTSGCCATSGCVTVVDLAVSLLGVLVVLPAVLVLAERARRARAPRRRRRRCVPELGRPGVSARPARARPPAGARAPGSSASLAVARARLHHAQHARAPTRPARAAAGGRAAAAVRGAARALGPRRRRAASSPGRATTGLRGARAAACSTPASWRSAGPVALAFFATASERCERQIDVRRARAPALPRRRASPPWRSAATATSCAADARARLGVAGRLRPRRRGRERLRGGGLPDDHVRLRGRQGREHVALAARRRPALREAAGAASAGERARGRLGRRRGRGRVPGAAAVVA